MGRLAEDIAAYLEARGVVGGASGWPVALAFVPPEPDRVVVLTETPGVPPGGRQLVERPGLQVRVRAAPGASAACEDRCYAVYRALHVLPTGGHSGADGTRYLDVLSAQSGAALLGYDARGRPEYAWTFEIWRAA